MTGRISVSATTKTSNWAILIAALLVLTIVTACGPKFEEMTAAQLHEYAQTKFAKRNFQDAVDAYEALIDLYPFSLYVTEAELGIADAYYMKRRWIEAEAAYDSFATRHPNHDRIDHVYFRSGMSAYEQKLAIDRDQAATQKSEADLSRVVSQYPDSQYFAEARLRLSEVRNDLAKRERYVAKHYWRNKEYYAAYKRYERVIRLFSDTDYYEESLYYGARCLIYLNEKDQAERLLRQLLRQNPEGKYADEAEDLLAKLG